MIRYARNVEPHPLFARDGVNPHLHHLLTNIAAHESRYPESGEIATVILGLGRTDLFPQLGKALAAEGHPDAKTLNWKRVGRAVQLDNAILSLKVPDDMRHGRSNAVYTEFGRMAPGRQFRLLADLNPDRNRHRGYAGYYDTSAAMSGIQIQGHIAHQMMAKGYTYNEALRAMARLYRRARFLDEDSQAAWRNQDNADRRQEGNRPIWRDDTDVALPTEIRTARPRDPRRMSRQTFATRPVKYAASPAARILESHLRDQGMHHAAAIVRGHYAQEKRMGKPTTVPLSWMGPMFEMHTTHDSAGEDGNPVPSVTVTEPHEKGMMMLSLFHYTHPPHDPDMKVISHHTLVHREHVPNWLKALDREGVHNADREYRLFARKYGSFPHHEPQLPPDFPPEEVSDWRPNEMLPEDYYSLSRRGRPVRYSMDPKTAVKAIAANPHDTNVRGPMADFLEENDLHAHPGVLTALREHQGPVWAVLRPDGKVDAGPHLSVQDVRRRMTAAGSHWWEPQSMRFFGTRVGTKSFTGPGGVWFVTSDHDFNRRRGFSLRHYDPVSGDINTVGEVADLNARRPTLERLAARFAQQPTPLHAQTVMYQYDPYSSSVPFAYWLRERGLVDDDGFRRLVHANRGDYPHVVIENGRIRVEPALPERMSRLPRGLKVRLSRAAQAYRSLVVRYKKCPRCGGSSRKTQSIMYRWRCKDCGLSHGRTQYAEEGGMPWVHGGKKGYSRPVEYAHPTGPRQVIPPGGVGGRGKRAPDAQTRQMVAMLKAGHSLATIGMRFGITKQAVARRLTLNHRMLNNPGPVVDYEAYRAPAGGSIVRGLFYKGGSLIPDLQKFAPTRQPRRTPR